MRYYESIGLRNGFLTTLLMAFCCTTALTVTRVVYFQELNLHTSSLQLAYTNIVTTLNSNRNIFSKYNVHYTMEKNSLPVSTYAFDSEKYFSSNAMTDVSVQEVNFKSSGIKKVDVKEVEISGALNVDVPAVEKIHPKKIDEIRSDELIKHYGFKIEIPETTNWVAMLETTKVRDDQNLETFLAHAEVQEQERRSVLELPERQIAIEQKAKLEAFVSEEQIALADTVMSTQVEDISTADGPPLGEVVDIAYDQQAKWHEFQEKNGEKSIAEQANVPVSGVVTKAIERAIEDKVTSELSIGEEVSKNYDYSMSTQAVDSQLVASAMQDSSRGPECRSQTVITASSIKLSNGQSSKLYNFEFIPEFDKYEGDQDVNGSIEICRTLNNSMSILSGVLAKNNHMRTRVDLSLEDGRIEFNIPMITREDFYNLLVENDLADNAQDKANILVELGESIQDFEIEPLLGEKFYFSGDFKILEEGDSDVRYVLVVGLTPGNILLRYRTKKNLHAEKLVHLGQDEIYFEPSALHLPQTDEFQLMEKNLLSNIESELSIDEEKLHYFNTSVHATKTATNLYKIRQPLLPYGTRKYLEFKHMAGSIFLGYWDQKVLSLPSAEFIVHVLDIFGLTTLQNRCLIQVNTGKQLTDFNVSSSNGKMESNLDILYLDKDGSVGREITAQTQKIFILGEEQGIINAQVKYADDSVDYLQSYCSQDDYLVEQL